MFSTCSFNADLNKSPKDEYDNALLALLCLKPHEVALKLQNKKSVSLKLLHLTYNSKFFTGHNLVPVLEITIQAPSLY